MAKAHCSGHKRYVPNCPRCQSAELKAGVGFPGGRKPPAEEIPDYEPDDEGVQTNPPEGQVSDAEAAGFPDVPKGDPWADGKTPAEGDDVGDFKPPAERSAAAEVAIAQGKEPDEEPGYTPHSDQATEANDDGTVSSEPAPMPATVPVETDEDPLEMAMGFFPRRLIPEGVHGEGTPEGPVPYEELIRRAVKGYIELGLLPEDAAIVVAAEVIQVEQLGAEVANGEVDPADDEIQGAFEAGVAAAPELTGCIADYNQGYNTGADDLLAILKEYYGPDARDADAPAAALIEYVTAKAAANKK